MIVDDEPINIKVVRKHLQGAGYSDFVTLTDPTAVLDALARERPDVLLLDVVMPGMTGLDILEAMGRAGVLLHVPVLILTASTDAATKLRALELGATDFLAKPVDPNELVPRLRNTLAAKAYHDHLARYSEHLEREVRARTADLEASRRHVIQCLARAGERRDDATGNHVVRVGRYAGIIARGMGLPPDDVEMIELAALLHDVGKIGIPDAILLKPAKLTPEEYDVMRKHCEYGEGIIAPALGGSGGVTEWWNDGVGESSVAAHSTTPPLHHSTTSSPVLATAARIAATHHEKWDGTGYPRGLAGEAIPVEGRVTAVADVFDALSTRRPYKPAYPADHCLDLISRDRGKHFDPRAVDALFSGIDQILAVQRQLTDAP
jgi:putative two-component system response regulator